MKFPNATPQPWTCKFNPKRGNDDPSYWRYQDEQGYWTTCIRPLGASIEDTIAEVWGTEHDDEANAALIVHAVNHHEALVEVLREYHLLALDLREIATNSDERAKPEDIIDRTTALLHQIDGA